MTVSLRRRGKSTSDLSSVEPRALRRRTGGQRDVNKTVSFRSSGVQARPGQAI
jgi:hypothetical protein